MLVDPMPTNLQDKKKKKHWHHTSLIWKLLNVSYKQVIRRFSLLKENSKE